MNRCPNGHYTSAADYCDICGAPLDAAAAAHSGEPVDWSTLAADLGFTDQAHLTRAFTSVVGTPPATYQRHA